MNENKTRDYRQLTDGGMHPDVAALHLTMQSMEDRLTDARSAIEALAHQGSPDVMRAVIVSAIKEAATDPSVSRVLYDAMASHAKRSLAEYVGERVIMALAVLALSGGLFWFAATGGGKFK